jgi:branched-subunit amino acid ABC-type transport system permease component
MMQTLYDGVVFGVLYALVAIGIVLIFRATGVLNLAQGAIATTAGYLAWYLTSTFGMSFLPALLIATAAGGLIGVILGAMISFLMPGKSALVQSVATFGFGMILQWFNRTMFGTRTQYIDAPFTAQWEFAGLAMSGRDMTVVIIGALVVLGVYLLINRTALGLRMRALAQDKETARLYGISEWRIVASSWFIGSALAAISGVLIAIFIQIDHAIAVTLMIQSFGAMVLGGFGSIGGAMLGGIVLGEASSIITMFLSSDLKNTIILVFVLIVLIVRPSGLMGGPTFKPAEGREAAQGPAVPGGRNGRGVYLDLGLALLIILVLPLLVSSGLPIPTITLALLVSTAISVMGVSFIYYFQHRITLGQGAFATFCVYFLYVLATGWNIQLSVPWLLAALVATALFAAVIGWITLRLDGFYFAVTTMFLPFGIAEIIGQMGSLTNGQSGIFPPEIDGLPTTSSSGMALYVQASVIFMVLGAALLLLMRSRYGRIWVAIRDTPEAVEATGINPVPYRVLAFALSGIIVGLGGYLASVLLSFITPEQFGLHWSILLLLATFAAGQHLLLSGSLFGAGIIILVPQIVSGQGGISDMVLGIALLVILMLPDKSLFSLVGRRQSTAGAGVLQPSQGGER